MILEHIRDDYERPFICSQKLVDTFDIFKHFFTFSFSWDLVMMPISYCLPDMVMSWLCPDYVLVNLQNSSQGITVPSRVTYVGELKSHQVA